MRYGVLLAVLGLGCVNTLGFRDREETRREPALAAAARVDQVGRQLLTANPFSIEAAFQVIGHPEPSIFHRDRVGVFISDALVEQCRSDGELAAVLASELGKMIAEERNLRRMGYGDTALHVPAANPMQSADLSADPARLSEVALRDVAKNDRAVNEARVELTDPKKIAAELLRTAGHDEKLLASVEPMLKNASRHRDLLRQLGGGGDPVWSR